MMFTSRRFAWLIAALALPTLAAAQDSTVARPPAVGPPIQRIATASAVSTEQIGTILGVRELPDGRVLVNDGARRRLLLMDTTLRTVEVVLDSLSEIANTYGTRPGSLIPYRADSTLFVDPASYAMVVLDEAGRIARVRSVWRVQDVGYVSTSSGSGWPGVDAGGRIVYRIPARPAPPLVAPPRDVPYFPQQPDSAFIVAVNLDTRRADTLAAIRIPYTEMRFRRMAQGGFTLEQVLNPMPTTDEWAVLPDGAVAIVRWQDYRVEYLNADKTWTSSAKLPFEWQRMADDDKERMVDSVKAAQQRSALMQHVTNMIRWSNQYNRPYPAAFKVPDGFALPPGLPKDWILPEGVKFPPTYVYACPPSAEPPTPPPTTSGAPGGPPSCMPMPAILSGGNAPPPPTMRQVHVVAPTELPDYRPPMGAGSVRADMDGNLWIRTIPPRPIPGGMVYDIVNRQGELVNRLQTPPGYTLVGFGRGKIVYLSMRDATGIHLARVRLR